LDYRDEGLVLRERVQTLEVELERARDALDRREQELRDAQATIRRMEGELRAAGLAPRPVARPAPYVFAALVVLVVASAAAFLLSKAPSPASKATTVEAKAPAPQSAAATALPQEAAAVSAAVAVPPPSLPIDPRRLAVSWPATIVERKGDAPAGTACTIDAKLMMRASGLASELLTVTCGGKVVHRSSDSMSGMSSFHSSFEERPGGEPGTNEYALVYSDIGARTGRSQLVIDSAKGRGAVWIDPFFRVDFALAKWSVPVHAEPFRLTPALRVAAAKVVEVSGKSPVAVGSTCRVLAWGAEAKHCGAEVRCGKNVLFGEGEGGYASCAIVGGEIASVEDEHTSDEEGDDPAVRIDVPGKRVVVREQTATTSWSVTLSLP
jgi:hypothetical protein